MKSHVYKKKRKKNGKTVLDRHYRGRYRLEGDFAATDIPLHTSDKQVAEKKLREIVREKQQERAGLIAPKLQRDAAQKPLLEHLDDFVADLIAKGRTEKYAFLIKARTHKLLKACKWRLHRDVSPDTFILVAF